MWGVVCGESSMTMAAPLVKSLIFGRVSPVVVGSHLPRLSSL